MPRKTAEQLLFTPEPRLELVDAPQAVAPLEDEPEGIATDSCGLTHGQIVERIMRLNPTATLEFLKPFSTPRLRDYMDHLVTAKSPRGRGSHWARRDDSPAVTSCESEL